MRAPLPAEAALSLGTGAVRRAVGYPGIRVLARSVRSGRQRVRAARLRRRPLIVTPAELATALGGRDPAGALRGRALAALPTVAGFEHELRRMGPRERSSLLARADAVADHRFDLLGSGPVDLGSEIDWNLDFRSGRRWPNDHRSRLTLVHPDRSDVKVPWELSRFQHLPLLAAAHRVTGEARYLDELGAQIVAWIESNPVEFGPNWICAMDVAIRGANWVAALAMCAEAAADEAWFEPALGSLLLHGRFVRTHLERRRPRNNHYLADIAGLLVVAALFADGPDGRRWLSWGARELERAMAEQVSPDGACLESSTAYHRLVCELLICGGQVVSSLREDAPSARFEARIEAMLEVVDDCRRPDGLVAQIGDGDDGRFLPLNDYGVRDPRDLSHLREQWNADEQRPAEGGQHRPLVTHPAAGLHVLRSHSLHVLVRAGGTRPRGSGGHAHNDQLSFELSAFGVPLVVDPGTGTYTADLRERAGFRSTASHSALMLDGREQCELDLAEPFSIPGDLRCEVLRLQAGERPSVRARHRGYERLAEPATLTRTVALAGEATVVVDDVVESSGHHRLSWTFPFGPGVLRTGAGRASLLRDGVGLEIVAPANAAITTAPGWLSPAYGVRRPTSFLRGEATSAPGTTRWRWTLIARPPSPDTRKPL